MVLDACRKDVVSFVRSLGKKRDWGLGIRGERGEGTAQWELTPIELESLTKYGVWNMKCRSALEVESLEPWTLSLES
jgi:hypothetical protein